MDILAKRGAGMTSGGAERKRAAGLGPGTGVQPPVHPSLADLYRGNVTVPGRFEPYRAAGLCIGFQDVPTGDAATMIRADGLADVPGWPTGGSLHVLRFRVGRLELFRTSYG